MREFLVRQRVAASQQMAISACTVDLAKPRQLVLGHTARVTGLPISLALTFGRLLRLGEAYRAHEPRPPN
jgi:hypothetical protein